MNFWNMQGFFLKRENPGSRHDMQTTGVFQSTIRQTSFLSINKPIRHTKLAYLKMELMR